MMSDNNQCEGIFIPSSSKDLFWYLGFILSLVVLFKLMLSVSRCIYTCFLAELLGQTVNWKKMGSWAIITGATDGIGKSYAKALAGKGFNIVLISRTEEKLKRVAAEIEKKFQVKTKIIAFDVTDESSIYEEVKKAVDNLEIGVLVNNVGKSYQYAEYITKVNDSEKFADDLIKANIVSVTRMVQIVLPQMERRKKGVIINISSLLALSPIPLYSIYSASKIYVHFFTRAIQEEYRNKGIIVQSVLPAYVSTNMSKMRPSFWTCTPDAFVYWALKSVGTEEMTYGYPSHKLLGYVQELVLQHFPENVTLSIFHRMMNNIRKRYYKKYGLTDQDQGTKCAVSSSTDN